MSKSDRLSPFGGGFPNWPMGFPTENDQFGV